MFSKIVGFAVLVAFATGQQHGSASSYISFKQNTGQSGGVGLGGGSSLGLGGGSSLGLGGGSAGLDGHGGSSYISYSQGQSSLGGSSLGGGLSLGGFSGSSLSLGASSGHGIPVHVEEHHAPAKYQFKYGVEDKHTGDIKQQEETRDGDVVKGSYSLHEPDGTILVVHYTADKHSGFNAVVQRQGHASHPQQSHH